MEFGVWNRALSAGERVGLAAGFAPILLTNGLVLYAPLRDSTFDYRGNTVTDTVAPDFTTLEDPGKIIRPTSPIVIDETAFAPPNIVYSDYGEWTALINSADYPSGTEFFFEATLATSSGASAAYARLFNVTDNIAVAASEVSSTDTTSERVRSNSLTIVTGDKVYKCQRGGVTGATFKCFKADVIAQPA